ncbi:hypothetical protein VTI74DRAFT_7597 [Chaetomium olivicolor]
MLEAATLQLPQSGGRSRFSKALPAPPQLPPLPSFDFESQLAPLVPEKELPRVQPEAPPPPRPPPKRADRDRTMAAIAKPLNSPLPPLPPKFAGPPPMSIPRRPVAALVTPKPALEPTSLPSLTPNSAAALASANPAPSPVGSFSSLLSAYSNHTADEPVSPSAEQARDVSSNSTYAVVSPNLDAQRSPAKLEAPVHDLPPLPSDQNVQRHEPNGRKADQQDLPPPPPLKDAQRGLSRPQTPTSSRKPAAQSPTQLGSPLRNGSPQQEQLWRRRSLKADKNLAVPDLKLVSSHGSTAASSLNASRDNATTVLSQQFPLPPRTNAETSAPATTSLVPPRIANGGLPGRNIRPVASEQAAPQGEAMGQEASRIREKLESGRKRESNEEPNMDGQGPQVSYTAATLSPVTSAPTVSPLSQRLPTPEYGTNDAKSPLPSTVVSPLSPASSPEPPGEPKPTITRKAVGAAEGQLRPARSSPSLAPGPANAGLGIRPPMGLPTSPAPMGIPTSPAPATIPSSLAPAGLAPSLVPGGFPPSLVPGGLPMSPAPGSLSMSPAPDRKQTPTHTLASPPTSSRSSQNRPFPAAPREEEQLPLSDQPQFTLQTPQSWAQQQPQRPPSRSPLSETGSIETVKPPPQPPFLRLPESPTTRPNLNPPIIEDLLPLTEPDPNQPDTTTNPGAALFPRGWYTPVPADVIPDARPLTERHFRCLTGHRYMTANRQRTNPVACRTCGHKDRNAECYICSACYLNVCSGCVGVLRRVRGDLGEVVRIVGEGRKEMEAEIQARVGDGDEAEAGEGQRGRYQPQQQRTLGLDADSAVELPA